MIKHGPLSRVIPPNITYGNHIKGQTSVSMGLPFKPQLSALEQLQWSITCYNVLSVRQFCEQRCSFYISSYLYVKQYAALWTCLPIILCYPFHWLYVIIYLMLLSFLYIFQYLFLNLYISYIYIYETYLLLTYLY